jgi:hypothetical protein
MTVSPRTFEDCILNSSGTVELRESVMEIMEAKEAEGELLLKLWVETPSYLHRVTSVTPLIGVFGSSSVRSGILCISGTAVFGSSHSSWYVLRISFGPGGETSAIFDHFEFQRISNSHESVFLSRLEIEATKCTLG